MRLILGLILISLGSLDLAADEKVTFDDHIKPIFQKRCVTCHNADRQSGGLDTTNFTYLLQGGGSGESIEPGDATSSFLYLVVAHEESPEMPPGGTKIPDAEIQLIAEWIDGGALENSGSVSRVKKKSLAKAGVAVGKRPEKTSFPLRLSLEPSIHTKKVGVSNSLATNPWSKLLAIAGSRQVLLYDSASFDFLGTLPFPEGQANDLRFSQNGELLIAGGGRHGLIGKVVAWDVNSGDRVLEIGEEPDNILASDISPNHSLIAFGGPQKLVRVFATAESQKQYQIKKHTDWITAIRFSPDGVLLASADRNGGLHLWEAETGNPYLTLAGHTKSIKGLAWRADGNVLASVGEDGAVRLWEIENGRQIKTWNAHNNRVMAIDFSRNGQLVTTGNDSNVKLWQQDGTLIRQFDQLGDLGLSVSFCNETENIFASDLRGGITVWKNKSSIPAKRLDLNPAPLKNRLAKAQSRLSEFQRTHAPLELRLAELDAEIGPLESQVQAQKSFKMELESKLAELNAEQESAGFEIAAASQSEETLDQTLTQIRDAIPLLKTAVENANLASDKLPEMENIAKTTGDLTSQWKELLNQESFILEQIEKLNNRTKFKTARLKTIQELIAQNLNDHDQAMKELDKLEKKLTLNLSQRAELQSQVSEGSKKLTRLFDAVERWSNEIEFDQQLVRKKRQFEEAQLNLLENVAKQNKAREGFEAAKAKFEAAANAKADSESTVDRIENELKTLRRRK